jgi:hypothetical protein
MSVSVSSLSSPFYLNPQSPPRWHPVGIVAGAQLVANGEKKWLDFDPSCLVLGDEKLLFWGLWARAAWVQPGSRCHECLTKGPTRRHLLSGGSNCFSRGRELYKSEVLVLAMNMPLRLDPTALASAGLLFLLIYLCPPTWGFLLCFCSKDLCGI